MIVESSSDASVSVIICAYTLGRWSWLCSAVDSVMTQTVMPHEIILCIDHNEELLNRCREQWQSDGREGGEVI